MANDLPKLVDNKEKSLDLFRYIKAVLEKKIEPNYDIRKLKEEEEFFDIDNKNVLPESDNVSFKKDNIELEEYIRIKKFEIKDAPKLPKELVNWVEYKNNIPVLKDFIYKTEYFDDNKQRVKAFKEIIDVNSEIPEVLKNWITKTNSRSFLKFGERYEVIKELGIQVKIEEKPELKNLFDNWLNNKWNVWSEDNQEKLMVNNFFERLYGVYRFIREKKEDFDLIYSHNIFTYQTENKNQVYGPILYSYMTIEYNTENNYILIKKDNNKKHFLDIDIIARNITNIDIDLIKKNFNNLSEEDLWNEEFIKKISENTIKNINSEGEYKIEFAEISIENVPNLYNYHGLYLLKKSNKNKIVFIDKIMEDINRQGEINNETILDIVSNENRTTDHLYNNDEELYFPLAYNEEQKNIKKRLDKDYGVVVQGPPGTGKTHTIANIISHNIAIGKKILVVSQKGTAMKVLKDKIPEGIKDLVLSKITNDHNETKHIVDSINSNLSKEEEYNQKNVNKYKKQLEKQKEIISIKNNELIKKILVDSEKEIFINNKKWTPMEASQYLNDNKENKILNTKDNLKYDINLNITQIEIDRYIELLKDIKKSDINYTNYYTNDNIEDFFNSFININDANNLYDLNKKVIDRNKNYNNDLILNDLEKYIKKIDLYITNFDVNMYDSKIFSNLNIKINIINEYKKIKKIFNIIEEKIIEYREKENILIDKTFDMYADIDIEIVEDILKNNIDKQGIIRFNFLEKVFKKGYFSKKEKELSLSKLKINNRNIRTKEDLLLIKNKLESDCIIKDISKRLNSILENNFSYEDMINIEEIKLKLDNIFNIKDIFNDLEIKHINYNIFDIGIIKELHNYLMFSDYKNKLNNLFKAISDKITELENRNEIQEIILLKNSLSNISNQKYVINIYNNKNKYIDLQKRSIELQELEKKIKKHLPKLLDFIKENIDTDLYVDVSMYILYKKLESWITELHSGDDIQKIKNDLEILNKEKRKILIDLIKIKSWKSLVENKTKEQTEALASYALAIKNLGKGGGKNADMYRKEIARHLEKALEIVPCIITTMDDISYMINQSKSNMFDIIIFDEASQIDITGISVTYLGKQILIVGDDEQSSPTSFDRIEENNNLINTYLSKIPNSINLSTRTSFFDLMKTKNNNIITLTEHFRCVKEIINFSNNLSYQGKLIPLRNVNIKDKLEPTLEAVFVKNGYEETNGKINKQEVECILIKLKEIIENDIYKDKDIGIISLLGWEQVKEIKKTIESNFDLKTIEERNIKIGDAVDFQGDERDVILLSMVASLDQNDSSKQPTPYTVNRKEFKQRINVAMSRAKDKMILFHSIPNGFLSNPDDLRKQIIDYFYNYKTEEIEYGFKKVKEKADSQFEIDVAEIICQRGYNVVPQYEVGRYKIDLVVMDDNNKLAIECDGDKYHSGYLKIEEDIERQSIIERAGWKFWRVSGSAFYKDKQKSLETLWKKLDELDIKPNEI